MLVSLDSSKVQDLGLIVDASNMAAGASIYAASWVDNVEWVRNILILASSDQQYDLVLQKRDKSGATSWGMILASAQILTGAGAWNAPGFSGNNALLGYSVKFGIKNSAAVPNTFARVRVQLLGL